MIQKEKHALQHLPFQQVRWGDGFWGEKVARNRSVTIPAVLHQLQETGHIDALKLEWKPGDPKMPHIFWESDLAKWMEGVAYSLATHPDSDLEALMDSIIDRMEKAQQPDGYLNAHFTVVEPQKRWSNLRDQHELYVAGHLIEAAVAYHQATGKAKFLEIMRRNVDLIAQVFGPGAGQKRGYDGHEEIELALMKLYRHTGEARYLELSQYFVNERGRQPHYFDEEARARGEDPEKFWASSYEYNQSHKPVREQDTAVGHSVRAVYLYAAMADLALETGDEALRAALDKLWDSVVKRRMYVTGGIGSTRFNEGWTWDYDLPNDSAYAETCAAIGLILWAHRMLLIDLDGKYADVIERALYNGVLSSLNLQGDHFFYVNPLEVSREGETEKQRLHLFTGHRKAWYGCACCPPNLARLFSSLGGYFYSRTADAFIIHQFGSSTVSFDLHGQPVTLRQETRYPWDGEVRLTIATDQPVTFDMRVRVPHWATSVDFAVNGEVLRPEMIKGYAVMRRTWQAGDTVLMRMTMPVERVRAHPRVAANAGKVAITRGPMVYCLESVDNGPNLHGLCLPEDSRMETAFMPDLLGGIVVITGQALREQSPGGALYQTGGPHRQEARITAVPYYTWDNRSEGDMLVWIRACS
jgi:DUF1680 family protein